MAEQASPSPEQKPELSIAGQFAIWYEQMADLVDLHGLDIQTRLEKNPELDQDPAFIEEKARFRREQDLLERMGQGASDYTFGQEVESFLGSLAIGDTNET